MQADTGAWQALPEIPWTTPAGANFRELGAETSRLLRRLEACLDGASPREHAMLSGQVARLIAKLRSLAQTELAVDDIYSAGWDARGRARGRWHLALVPRPAASAFDGDDRPDPADETAGQRPRPGADDPRLEDPQPGAIEPRRHVVRGVTVDDACRGQ